MTHNTLRTTPWFPANVKPARAGAYEGEFLDDGEWQSGDGDFCWTGASWRYRYNKGGCVGAWIDLRLVVKQGRLRWRGLASDPTKPERKPREWMTWGVIDLRDEGAPMLCESRADSRKLARAVGVQARVLRLRITEV